MAATAAMFASTSYCSVARPSSFKGDATNLSSAAFTADSLALKANVCRKPTRSRSKSLWSRVDISAVLAERPVETLVLYRVCSSMHVDPRPLLLRNLAVRSSIGLDQGLHANRDC